MQLPVQMVCNTVPHSVFFITIFILCFQGSGKSTLFRLLMSCDSNKKSIDLPESIILDEDSSSSLLKSSTSSEQNVCHAKSDDSTDIDATTTVPSTSLACNTYSTITLPSPNIVEISQSFYWPLYTKPIDWIYQMHLSDDIANSDDMRSKVNRVVEELNSLYFTKSVTAKDHDLVNFNDASLVEELKIKKEDWFSELSGGQKSKVELVRFFY